MGGGGVALVRPEQRKVRKATALRIRVNADNVSHGPTTQTTPGIDDRRGKREVEDKTEYKDRQIDGWKTNCQFFLWKIFSFEKDTFLPVKIQSR